jgi:hypothetical protein
MELEQLFKSEVREGLSAQEIIKKTLSKDPGCACPCYWGEKQVRIGGTS